jgi:serine/threonine protein phosphatase 1
MKEAAFIGDVHGELDQLRQLVADLLPCASSLTFLGDYVNRGPDSRAVIEFLIQLEASKEIPCRFVSGNHDEAFLNALRMRELGPFLRIGGAATVHSYVPHPTFNVLQEFLTAVPASHVRFLEGLQRELFVEGVHAAHHPRASLPPQPDGTRAKYGVYGHIPQPSGRPVIGTDLAGIDTGCGTLPRGRLTGLLWPSLTWVQSDPTKPGKITAES